MDNVTIRIQRETQRKLDELRRPGERSFDAIIQRLIKGAAK